MATFEQHIEGLTQIDITTTSAPTVIELSQILVEGLIHTVNTITTLKPEELPRFTQTTNSTTNVTKEGRVLSVAREHNSQTVLRPCTPINPSLRTEAADVNSLHYRSKYNPAYYEMNNTVRCVPAPNDATDNDIVVIQVKYDTGLLATDNYNAGAVQYFPTDYEYLLVLYGAAMTCSASASDIQSNMPTVPTAPLSPDFTNEATTLPTVPIFVPPEIKVGFANISSAISREDFDLVDNYVSLFDKKVEIYGKDFDRENSIFTQELEIFKSDLEKATKDSDRKTQVEGAEYKAELERYQSELESYKNELQEKMAKYKWYASQYISFLNQYNQSITGQLAKQKKKEERPKGENK